MLEELLDQLNSASEVRHAGEADGRGVPFVVVPDGYKIEKLELLLPNPIITRQSIAVRDIGSFSGYAKKYRNTDSVVFANDGWSGDPLKVNPSVVAIFDYHGPNQAHHGVHRATLVPPLSEAWKRWVKFCSESFGQAEFAMFLEENSIDVVEPVGADLVEITRGIQATQKGEFKSGMRLNNGSFHMTYSMETTGSIAQGDLDIPESITLGIPVFENDDAYRVKAWLRYRIVDGKLLLKLELHRPRYIYGDAFMTIMKKVADAMPDNLILLGAPG